MLLVIKPKASHHSFYQVLQFSNIQTKVKSFGVLTGRVKIKLIAEVVWSGHNR